MNNENNTNNTNWIEHNTSVDINSSILASKALIGALTQADPMTVVDLCLEEILSGVEFNTHDLPFYAAALDILLTSVKAQMTEKDDKLYTSIMTHIAVFSDTHKQEASDEQES